MLLALASIRRVFVKSPSHRCKLDGPIMVIHLPVWLFVSNSYLWDVSSFVVSKHSVLSILDIVCCCVSTK